MAIDNERMVCLLGFAQPDYGCSCQQEYVGVWLYLVYEDESSGNKKAAIDVAAPGRITKAFYII